MTGKEKFVPRQKSLGHMIFGLLSLFCFLLIFRNPDLSMAYMGRGLTLCVTTVIPSLYPFMVISEMMVGSGAGEALGRILSRPMRWIFGLSGAGASAVVLGSLCGFPVGASTAFSLYDHNLISKEECQHLLTFVNQPSSAFLTLAVGVSMYGSRRLGVILYGLVVGCGLLVGFVARFWLGGVPRHNHPHYPMGFHPDGSVGRGKSVGGRGMVEVVTRAVSSSAMNLLTVCGYVVFFSGLTGVFTSGVLAKLSPLWGEFGTLVGVVLCGVLELSSGMSQVATLGELGYLGEMACKVSLVLAAMVGGWSGLSVHCQVMTLGGGRGISFKPYFVAKGVQSLLCGVGMGVILLLVEPSWLLPTQETVVGNLLDMTRVFSLPALPSWMAYGGMLWGVWMHQRLKGAQP